MCFYQAQYEWAGLLDNHPDLFLKAEKLEQKFGGISDRRMSNFYWYMNRPLHWIRSNFANIVKDRAKKVIRFIQQSEGANDLDMLSTTSCGAYCGK